MAVAPDKILEAGLMVLGKAVMHCRNLSYLEDADSRAELTQLSEAIHNLPDYLCSWRDDGLQYIRSELSTYDHVRWQDSYNYRERFDELMEEGL